MKRSIKVIIIFFILTSINLNIFSVAKSRANITYVNFTAYTGGILPKENVSLSLTSANVVVDADMSNLRYIGPISFKGNYTIFNPEDDINLTIGAPFEFNLPQDCTILLNGTIVPYIILTDYEIQYDNESDIWNQFLYNRDSPIYILDGFWVVCDISIPKNTSVELQYEFKTPKFKNDRVEGYIDIVYDVGTARLWNGTISEKVDMRIKGHLPTSVYFRQYCVVSDTTDGKSYSWHWNNEIIWMNYVGLEYYFNFEKNYLVLYNSIRIPLILCTSLLGIIFVLIMKYYKRK